jgi:TatD DNase family protein
MNLFDSHCHFDFSVFDNDREALWQKCNQLGINYLIIPGVAPEQWQTADDIAVRHNNIYHGVGLHPWWLEKQLPVENIADYVCNISEQLQQNISLPKCHAIGECGLDASIETPMELQQKILDVHLTLAKKNLLPLIIHCHKAHNELCEQLQAYKFPAGGVIHAFSGSYELALRYWKMGFRLGIGGTITYVRANKTRNAVKQLPIESMILETDAPDMPIYGKQGERNSPENLLVIAQTFADLRGETLAYIAEQTTSNASTLFKIN